MIMLQDLHKSFGRGRGRKVVVAGGNVCFPTGAAVALLGRNGAGKSTLLRMIAGTIPPDQGRILRQGSLSWPVGFAGSFHPDLTGAQNIRFIARIYGVDSQALADFTCAFAGLGAEFHQPFRHYSAGMRARLAFGASLGIRFDTYLIDEVTSVGDAAFKAASETLLRERLQTAGAIVISHSLPLLRRLCSVGAVLEAGRLHWFDHIDEAIAFHRHMLDAPLASPAVQHV